MPDQQGRTAIVTGANSGLAQIVARERARAGAQVVLAARDTGRTQAAEAAIRTTAPSASLELARLDLADLSPVRTFSERFLANHDRLDLLVNNASLMAAPYRRTADGFELQFGTNHLGHFALTGLLLPAPRDRVGARVVTVSSNARKRGAESPSKDAEARYQKRAGEGSGWLGEFSEQVAAGDTPITSYAATNATEFFQGP